MSTGALLIHGFTATPECLESLIVPLKESGFLVEAPLLAGHGKTAEALSKITWQDWYQGVVESFQTLQKNADTVCVAGLSLGGLLGLLLASEFPVEKLALLATPVIFTSFMAKRVLPVVGNTFLKHLYPYQPKLLGPAIHDPAARKNFRNYSKMPIRSLMEIIKIQKEVRSRLPAIQTPTLIIHSLGDKTAPYENMAYVQKHIGTKEVRTLTLNRSNHVITMDYEKELVAKEVSEFFSKMK